MRAQKTTDATIPKPKQHKQNGCQKQPQEGSKQEGRIYTANEYKAQ